MRRTPRVMVHASKGVGVRERTRDERATTGWMRSGSTRLWFGYALGLVLLGAGIVSGLSMTLRSVAEALVLGLAVAALVVHPSIAPILRSASRRACVTAGCVVLALVAAHVAKNTAYTFPFVDWRMFGRSSRGPLEGLRLSAVRADGSLERIVPGAVISDATVSRLDKMIRKYLAADDADRLQQIIDAVVEFESPVNSGTSSAVGVEISKCVASIETPTVTQCTPVRTVPVTSQGVRR